MKFTLEKNYEKASSQNLPPVDFTMLSNFLSSNLCQSVESRGVKASRATRPNYGDSAVGWVQLRRQDDICTVKARICPEHKIRERGYDVTVVIDEGKETIEEAKCHDCAASAGGCKHAAAFVAWLHRRSEDPSPTEISCYWKKSRLCSIGSKIKCMTINEMVEESQQTKNMKNHVSKLSLHTTVRKTTSNQFLQRVIRRGIEEKRDNHLILFFKPRDTWERASLHYLAVNYTGDKTDGEEFLQFCKNNYTYKDCEKVAKETKNQAQSPIWYDMRYGRITASIFYQASHCHTPRGSLHDQIMGKRTIDTPAMERGRKLEAAVIEVIEELISEKISKSGLLLSPQYPWLGASPDGLTATSVIEVKCPMKTETFSNYYHNNVINPKFRAQMQLQMFFAGQKEAKFCIADPKFMETKHVTIVDEFFDQPFINTLLQQANAFWVSAIFPPLMNSVHSI